VSLSKSAGEQGDKQSFENLPLNEEDSSSVEFFDLEYVLTVEQPRHEQVPKPTQLAVGFDLHHRGAKGQPPSAGGPHAHHELLLDLRSPIHSTYKRVPLGISGEVGEHLPDTLGGSFYLDLGTQLLHGDLLDYLLC
jgi:hypothetical protein